MNNNPNEIFGISTKSKINLNNKNSQKYFCRFLNKQCDKQSRMLDYPMGVCSVNHTVGKSIICPHRFLEDNIVFSDIANDAFGNSNNVLLFSEVKLGNVGSFDFVLVKHKPISSKIEDFCIVEFQSDNTTGTGKLVDAMQDFMSNKNVINSKYNFGLNTYNTIKLSYIQMLIKGQVMEKWNKNIYWVVQKYVFENMINRFKLKNMEFSEKNNTKFFLYDLFENGKFDNIKLVDTKSSSIKNLLKAFTEQPTPAIDDFIKVLENKIELKLGISVKQ
ncbi:MAG: hypothetical protein FWC41_12990 [Firmicutes bacterium]|nr:hypothetical protein [Bacillota bacterium]